MDASSQSFPAGLQERGKSVRSRLSRGEKLAVLGQVALVSFMAWLVWCIDDWRAISLEYPEYYYWVGGSLLVVLLPALAWRRPGAILIPLVWCAYLGLLPHADTSALKPLLRGANSLTVGMDRAEILSTIHREYAGTPYELPIVVNETEERILLRPRPYPGNSESLLIHLRDSRFTSAGFSPD